MDVQMSFASFVRGILDPESSAAGSGPSGATTRASNIGQTRRSKTRPHGPWPLGAGIERGELHRLQGGALKNKNGTNQSAVKRSKNLKHHETS